MCDMRGKQQTPQLDDVEGGEEEEEEEEYRRSSVPPEGTGFWMSAVTAASGMDMIPGESGFISSQPSMAEFILPHHMATGGEPSPGPYPQPIDPQQPVQEYPWMKEKKTARKNNQQGEFTSNSCIQAGSPGR